jgi:hypothetical protein
LNLHGRLFWRHAERVHSSNGIGHVRASNGIFPVRLPVYTLPKSRNAYRFAGTDAVVEPKSELGNPHCSGFLLPVIIPRPFNSRGDSLSSVVMGMPWRRRLAQWLALCESAEA